MREPRSCVVRLNTSESPLWVLVNFLVGRDGRRGSVVEFLLLFLIFVGPYKMVVSDSRHYYFLRPSMNLNQIPGARDR